MQSKTFRSRSGRRFNKMRFRPSLESSIFTFWLLCCALKKTVGGAKNEFHHFWFPPGKNFGKIPYFPPPGKNPSDAHVQKLTGLKNCICGPHVVRGPVVGPHWLIQTALMHSSVYTLHGLLYTQVCGNIANIRFSSEFWVSKCKAVFSLASFHNLSAHF